MQGVELKRRRLFVRADAGVPDEPRRAHFFWTSFRDSRTLTAAGFRFCPAGWSFRDALGVSRFIKPDLAVHRVMNLTPLPVIAWHTLRNNIRRPIRTPTTKRNCMADR